MRKVIETTKKHSLAIIISIALISGIASVISLYAEKAEAVTVQSVGVISGAVAPRAATEYFTVKFVGTTGVMDMDGWTAYVDNTLLYTFEGVSVAAKASLKVCEAAVAGCDLSWEGGTQFDDVAGTYELRNEKGHTVYSVTYSGLTAGDDGLAIIGQVDGSYVTEVYGKSDKLSLCHEDGKGSMSDKNVTAGSFLNGYLNDRNGHNADAGDIIPAFFYDIGDGLGYFGGTNWEGNAQFLANGCM